MAGKTCGICGNAARTDRLLQVIVFTKEGNFDSTGVAELFEQQGCQLHVTHELSDWLSRVELECSNNSVLVVDLMSTLTENDAIGGYDQFLRKYAASRQGRNLRLIVICPSPEKSPGQMIGYGSLVSAYLRPSTPMRDMISIILRVAEEGDGR